MSRNYSTLDYKRIISARVAALAAKEAALSGDKGADEESVYLDERQRELNSLLQTMAALDSGSYDDVHMVLLYVFAAPLEQP